MIITGKSLPRRTFLKGMGAAVALPFLDSMVPAFAAPAKAPVRLAFLYVPNGIDMKNWNVAQEGPLGELPRILKPLEAFRGDMIQIGNLTNNRGRAWLDGPGDHGRCAGSYLTGVQVRKTTVDIKASISCDQIIANKIGHETRFASLELGMDDSRQAGDCDSGYSCAYTNNLAWRSETQPLPPILDPRVLFERLFGTGVVLTGRSEGFFVGRPDLHQTIRRLVAYADAGAECLYAPGLRARHLRTPPEPARRPHQRPHPRARRPARSALRGPVADLQ